ncbi:MAG: ABC transporter permease [Bdellovibrionales bacterium]
MIWNHFKFNLMQYLRQPSYMVSTMIFPAIFFLMFAKENAKTAEMAQFLMGSFCRLCCTQCLFLQFGVGVAQERSSQWNSFIKTLPFHRYVSIASKVLTALTFALLAAWVVVAIVVYTTEAAWNLNHFIKLNVALIFGGVPFCLMGLTLGMITTENSALPICNLFYLSLSFAGGLWIPPNALAQSIQDVVEYLPTYHYGIWVRSTLLNESFPTDSVRFLALTAVAMIGIVAYLSQRQARQNN